MDEQCAWICVSNKVNNINAKVFNLLSGANETKFLAQHECVSVNVDWMKVYVIQSKHEIIMNVGVSV